MVVGDRAAGPGRERGRPRRPPSPRARSCATAAGRTSASRRIRRSVGGDEVEQDQRAQLVGVALRVGLRAAHARSRSNGARSRRSPPRRRTGRSAARAPPPAGRACAQRARELEHRRRAAPRRRWRRRSPAGPWCRSARRSRPPASRPAACPTTLRSPGCPGTGSKRPCGSARRSRPASPRSVCEPAGRGPSSTWRSQLGPGARARRSGRPARAARPSRPAAAPAPPRRRRPSAITATTAPTTHAPAATPCDEHEPAPHGLVG